MPAVVLSVVLDAGNAADPKDKLGTQALMLAMLKEGATSRNSIQIAEEQERLGANIDVGASMDRTAVSMYALMPNLDASMDLMADVIKNPAFEDRKSTRLNSSH